MNWGCESIRRMAITGVSGMDLERETNCIFSEERVPSAHSMFCRVYDCKISEGSTAMGNIDTNTGKIACILIGMHKVLLIVGFMQPG